MTEHTTERPCRHYLEASACPSCRKEDMRQASGRIATAMERAATALEQIATLLQAAKDESKISLLDLDPDRGLEKPNPL